MRMWLLGALLLFALPVQAADRVLALAPHVCEMLYAIGAGANVAGVVDYCDFPAAVQRKPHVGNYRYINVEAALHLHPQVAVVLNREIPGVTRLEQMGVRIVISDPRSFEAIFHDLLMLGKLTGQQQQAEALVRQQRMRLWQTRQQAAHDVRVFYELWPDPLMTAGGKSFIHSLITLAGGHNVFGDIALESPHVNIEAVLRARPELIIIPLERRNLAERRRFWQHWLGTSVRFAVIDPDLLHRPGPRLIEGLEQLQQALLAGRILRMTE